MSEISESTQNRPSRRRERHPLPLWVRIGDNLAEVIVILVLLGGLFCEGYVNESRYWMRAWSGFGCALLGMWACVGATQGRWSGPAMRIPRWIVALFALVILWTGFQLIPLPSSFVTRISPVWSEIHATYLAADLDFPASIPLAHSPEKGMRAWHQLVAGALFFIGVAQLTTRRTCSMRLITAVALISVVEGYWGLSGQYFGKNRAIGAVFNPNHHAALAILGMPLFFARIIQWKRFNPAIRDSPIISGTHPFLLFLALGFGALFGWLNSLSRGSILFGGSILVVWAIIEIIGNWRDSRIDESPAPTPMAILLAGAGYMTLLLGLTVVLVSSPLLDNLLSRGTIEDELQGRGRLELWKAVFRGLSETPWLGFGLSGTETALNRYTVLPLGTIPIWAHNDYVQMVAELGLPVAAIALILLAFVLGGLTIQWAAQMRQIPWTFGLTHRAAIAGVLITLAHAAVDFHLRIPLIGFSFLILLALAVNQGPLLISPRMYGKLLPFRMPRWRRDT